MDIQSKTELFLSKAAAIVFAREGEDTVMNFFFDRKGFKHYKEFENHKNLHDYFTDKQIKLVIKETETEYRISLVDTQSSDIFNLSNVKPETISLGMFLNSVKKDDKFNMIVSGISEDGDTLLLPPIRKLIKIHGYSYYPLK